MTNGDRTEPTASFDKRLVVLARSRRMRALGWGLTLGGAGAFAAFLAHLTPFGVFGVHAFAIGLFLLGAVAWRNYKPDRLRARVSASATGIAVDGKPAASRAEIANGFYQPRRGSVDRSSVRVVDRRGRILFEAEVDDETQALAILHALGLDPERRRAAFRTAPPMVATLGRQLAWYFGMVFGLMGIVSLLIRAGFPQAPTMFLLVFPAILAAIIPSKIVVGVDGLLLTWLWRRRFLPMADVRMVTREDDRAIRIHLMSGEEVVVHTSMRSRHGTSEAVLHRDAVLARIEEALATFRARGMPVDVSALVGRGERTSAEWLDALKKLRTAEGGYRAAAVRDDDLWRVVEDPSAHASARAGAAMILKRSLDADGKERVRIAAEATASPRLRVVLDAAAAEPEEKLEAALAELGAEEGA